MIGEDRCPTCGQKRKISSGQRALYWKLLREFARLNPEFDAETYHEYMRRKFLPLREIELPDWSTMLIPISTSNLPMHRDDADPHKPNFDDYFMEVEKWCAERGVYLENM